MFLSRNRKEERQQDAQNLGTSKGEVMPGVFKDSKETSVAGARWDPGEHGLRRGWGEAGARQCRAVHTLVRGLGFILRAMEYIEVL